MNDKPLSKREQSALADFRSFQGERTPSWWKQATMLDLEKRGLVRRFKGVGGDSFSWGLTAEGEAFKK